MGAQKNAPGNTKQEEDHLVIISLFLFDHTAGVKSRSQNTNDRYDLIRAEFFSENTKILNHIQKNKIRNIKLRILHIH